MVSKGFWQVEGIDFQEVFSPIVNHKSIRTVLALLSIENKELEQLYVNTTFLHGNLEERIYMQRPQMFEVKSDTPLVFLLKRSLYGLNQVPR